MLTADGGGSRRSTESKDDTKERPEEATALWLARRKRLAAEGLTVSDRLGLAQRIRPHESRLTNIPKWSKRSQLCRGNPGPIRNFVACVRNSGVRSLRCYFMYVVAILYLHHLLFAGILSHVQQVVTRSTVIKVVIIWFDSIRLDYVPKRGV